MLPHIYTVILGGLPEPCTQQQCINMAAIPTILSQSVTDMQSIPQSVSSNTERQVSFEDQFATQPSTSEGGELLTLEYSARSLLPKFDYTQAVSVAESPDMNCVVETWLSDLFLIMNAKLSVCQT